MAEIKALDQAGVDFLINEEGLRLSPYLDSVGVPTIGIGNTYYEDGRKVTLKDPKITKERAIEIFKTILAHYETAVWSVTRDDINQNQFNALCSLCYNIGVNGFKGSTVVKRVNKNPSDPLIAQAFEMWRKPKVLLGRRKREHKLYFS
jgi:lysozyme